MFGYVTINRGELKVRELETYESYYCGLCRVLKDRYGLAGCTMLNYDMTFLGMLLSSLYEEKEEPAKRVCRPGFKRPLLKKKSIRQVQIRHIVFTFAQISPVDKRSVFQREKARLKLPAQSADRSL